MGLGDHGPHPPWVLHLPGLPRCVSSQPSLSPWGKDVTRLGKTPPGGHSDTPRKVSSAIPLSNSTPNLSANPKGSSCKSRPPSLTTPPGGAAGTPGQPVTSCSDVVALNGFPCPSPPPGHPFPSPSQSIFQNQVRSHQPSTQSLARPLLTKSRVNSPPHRYWPQGPSPATCMTPEPTLSPILVPLGYTGLLPSTCGLR